jgi:thiamine kinase-like enzyme
MQPEAIAARLWPGSDVDLEPLGGGITNRNFKVVCDGEAYVLRIGGRDTELLGIDRAAEHEATQAAAAIGVGPEVVAFVEAEGVLVTRFIQGRVVPEDELRRPEMLSEVAATLRTIHRGPPLRARFDAFRVVESYQAVAAARGVDAPDYAWAHELSARIEQERGRQPAAPCHNDLLNANFIHDGERLRIVDWEYAGMGDVFFDLANFSVNHSLGDTENELLLEAYFGALREGDLEALRLMRFMSDFREAMWGVVQQAISGLDFDFRGYAEDHFERLRGAASEVEQAR